ncbi:MAG: MarR family transcriptional regulator, partial [Crenarchaeota archaeon]|nr:MarR family transcriptional regulator [Thermoproteota archaeon]
NPEGSEIVRNVIVGNDGYFSDIYAPNLIGSWSVSLRLPSDSKYRIKQSPQPLVFSVYERVKTTESKEILEPSQIMVLILLVAIISILAIILYRHRKKMPPPPEEYIISDEELILRILRNSGGRLLQKQIKEATGFSKAKTSMVLSELQKKGLIRKIKRGREYIVELA